MQLAGKGVLITGASQGIGAGIARAFAEEGCTLHLVARSPEKLKILRDELHREYAVDVFVHAFDLSAPGAAARVSEATIDADISIVVNNAGAIPGGNLWDIDQETWREAWDLKVLGYIDMCRVFYPRLRAAGGGVVLNNIGNGGENPDSDYIAGSSGNAALMAFTRALGGRSLDDQVRVIGVNPGPVATDRFWSRMATRMASRGYESADYSSLMKEYPQGRVATVDEVADLFPFLASPRSSYTSGTIITIDGGMSSRRRV